MNTTVTVGFAICLAVAAAAADGEPSDVTASGFTVTFATTVASEPERVWQAFTQLPRWWSSAHTWSGQASNLSLDPHAGGCWCERWGNGQSVVHGQVLMALPGSTLRLRAWLGPLHELPVSAVLTFSTDKRDGATRLRVTYRVAGAPDAGLDQLAPRVDKVIGEQVGRLKAFIETGKAD
jgi:uncharacterized protein YndB with AHSA1/START domain